MAFLIRLGYVLILDLCLGINEMMNLDWKFVVLIRELLGRLSLLILVHLVSVWSVSFFWEENFDPDDYSNFIRNISLGLVNLVIGCLVMLLIDLFNLDHYYKKTYNYWFEVMVKNEQYKLANYFNFYLIPNFDFYLLK